LADLCERGAETRSLSIEEVAHEGETHLDPNLSQVELND
jgi:hypothetical protein